MDACPAPLNMPTQRLEDGQGGAYHYGADKHDIRMWLVPSPYCMHCWGPISHPVPLPIPAPAPVTPSRGIPI